MSGYDVLNQAGERIGWSLYQYDDGYRYVPVEESSQDDQLSTLKLSKIAELKQYVRLLIEATDWRIERAKEREAIGAEGETLTDVYSQRETYRRAGNRAEKEIQALDNAESIQSYQFAITDADTYQSGVLTKLQFISRITVDEYKNIAKARKTNAELDRMFQMLELSEYINTQDESTIASIQSLVQAGFITEQRAEEILA